MKLTASKANLVRLLSQVGPIAKPKTTSPILSCVLLETEKGELTAKATDTFQSVSTKSAVDISEGGGAAVHAKDLLERVKTMPDGTVSLAVDGSALRVTSGKRKHSLPIMPPEDFPAVRAKLTGGATTLPGRLLLDLLRRTKPMASTASDRAQLMAVYLEFEAGKITAAATDGHRLSFVTEPAPNVSAAPGKIVPLDAVEALSGLLDPEADAEVGLVGQELLVKVGDLVFATKLVEGAYPPVRQFFTSFPERLAILSRKGLIESLMSVDKATSDTLKSLVELELSSGVMKLRAEGKGGAEDELEAEYEGPSITVGANARYLIDALSAIDTTEVRFNCGGELDPLVIRPNEGETPIEIIMPTRIRDGK